MLCVRPVLLYYCETSELTVADEARLHGVEEYMIKMCEARLDDNMLTDLLCDRVDDVVVKIEDMTIQSCLWWYGHIMHGNINSKILEVTEIEVTGKRKKG